MKVIFCDVDGVLNNRGTTDRSPGGYRGVSNVLIHKLRRIVEATGAKIVLSSDWRLIRNIPGRKKDYRYLVRKLRIVCSLSIYDHTDDISWEMRGREILKYLKDHPEVTAYAVLDDIPFRDFSEGDLPAHLVLTDDRYGLTDKDVERAVRILQGEKAAQVDLNGFF